MRAAPILVLLTACGRLGFDTTASIATGDGATTSDDGATGPDAAPCAGGDNLCAVECLATDPDCITTCGDGRCVGNAGELCVSCADCETQEIVCGNGACDTSEDSSSCYADCGPTPWTWNAEEEDLLARINTARANTTCPGGGGPMSAGVVVRKQTLDAGSREWAWEATYQTPLNSDACNGRTYQARVTAAGGLPPYDVWVAVGPADTGAALANWLSSMNTCTSILNTAYTRVGIGVSFINGQRGYVLMLD